MIKHNNLNIEILKVQIIEIRLTKLGFVNIPYKTLKKYMALILISNVFEILNHLKILNQDFTFKSSIKMCSKLLTTPT